MLFILGKGELPDTEGLSTSQLRKGNITNNGISRDDIFGISKRFNCLIGDQINDIDDTMEDLDSIYKNKYEENFKIVSDDT